MSINNIDISLGGEVAVELLEPEELENHKWLLEQSNGKTYSKGMLYQTVKLYRARRGTCELDGHEQKKPINSSNGSRVTALINLLLDAAEKAGIKDEVKTALDTGRIDRVSPFSLTWLRAELESMGWPKERFVLD